MMNEAHKKVWQDVKNWESTKRIARQYIAVKRANSADPKSLKSLERNISKRLREKMGENRLRYIELQDAYVYIHVPNAKTPDIKRLVWFDKNNQKMYKTMCNNLLRYEVQEVMASHYGRVNPEDLGIETESYDGEELERLYREQYQS